MCKKDLRKIDEFYLRKEYIDKLIEMAKTFMEKNGKMQVSEFRDLSELSRKQAVAVLEYMDKKNISKRIDDYRVLI